MSGLFTTMEPSTATALWAATETSGVIETVGLGTSLVSGTVMGGYTLDSSGTFSYSNGVGNAYGLVLGARAAGSVSTGLVMRRTVNGSGTSWTQLASLPNTSVASAVLTSATTIVAVGSPAPCSSGGCALVYDTAPNPPTTMIIPSTAAATAVNVATDSGRLYIGTSDGKVFRRGADGNYLLDYIASGPQPQINEIWATGEEAWAVGNAGVLLHRKAAM